MNTILDATVAGSLLSSYGKRARFPKGIVVQSQEAGVYANRANGSAGVALKEGHHMTFPLFQKLNPLITADELVAYAPTAGDMRLRRLWYEEMKRKNPALEECSCSLPMVTAGLTHSLRIAAELFVDEGDDVIIANPAWDNYELIFSDVRQGKLHHPSLFDENLNFNFDAVLSSIRSVKKEKAILLLNFPNNPTGYTPSEKEYAELTAALVQIAEEGKKLLVIIDDAYYGLFHTSEACTTSLFAFLCNAHPNILALKCDAATKEALAWGLRMGFLTFGGAGLTGEHYDALLEKCSSAMRSSISSCSRTSQTLLIKVLENPECRLTLVDAAQEIKKRFELLMQEVSEWPSDTPLHLYPANSGYFCTFACKGDAEQLRVKLLHDCGIGTIALKGNLLRLAYSAIDEQEIPFVMQKMQNGARKLWS
ncbi:MAG: aminotransferase class I/II-fold pyridoxal phosphate-dependent enzyme [Sphaerochaetaceae bacterium]